MKALIVASGQSSVNPTASNLCNDRDLFRVNTFFLEPTLLFGKKIKFLSFIGEPYNLYLIDYLRSKNIYKIEQANYREMSQKYFFTPLLKTDFTPWKKIATRLSLKNSVPGFDDINMLHKTQKHAKITSGVYLINCAIQMGYQDIAIIGIDFYSEKSLKKYPIIIPNCLKKIKLFEGQFKSERLRKKKGNSYDDELHSYEIDSQYIINLANKYTDVHITAYVDEQNPFKNWTNIAKQCTNVQVIKMPHYQMDSSPSHCINDIENALYEYKKQYFWQDIWMRIRSLINYRKSIVKKIYYTLLDKLHTIYERI